MSANGLFVILSQSIHVIPLFLVTVGCVLLLTRAQRGAAVTMLAGNLIMIAITVIHGVVTAMIMTSAEISMTQLQMFPVSRPLWRSFIRETIPRADSVRNRLVSPSFEGQVHKSPVRPTNFLAKDSTDLARQRKFGSVSTCPKGRAPLEQDSFSLVKDTKW